MRVVLLLLVVVVVTGQNKVNLNRNVIFKNYNMVARVVAGFHQLSYFQLHCGGASGGDGLHEHNLVV